jgi:hypothetical protein
MDPAKHPVVCLVFLPVALACAVDPAHAQSASADRFEAGAFIGAINFREVIREKPFALGIRFGYRITERLAVEAEVISCPESSGNFGQLLLVAGPRFGFSVGSLSVAGKLRPGVIHFGGASFRAHNPGIADRPVLNAGVVVELAYSPKVAVRVDAGDTIVQFGSSEVRGPLQGSAGQNGTTHNPEGSVGLVFRF